ncbi:MAG: morphogenetic protein [Alcaligenaceae bacterium]|nr:morphogenetic protein [Alcaligenaceae bacterium SAGV5]MPS51232.1 morphogenetic protein [Alcaligenaceae bacterium SAGV3]MPT57271.1 morphogenetic protein [Alcaligenaceae bacterium]
MKARPILFSSTMVSAILEDRKTQTRRAIKPRKDWLYGCSLAPNELAGEVNGGQYHNCPHGEPGALMWVREEHYRFGHWEPVPTMRTRLGRQKWRFVPDSDELRYTPPVSFRRGRHHKDPTTPAWHKRIARFMPRSASRITLEITGIHAEKLRDISETDATAEGTPHSLYMPAGRTAVENFAHLWECLHGEGSWRANPWVWVVTFRRIDT